MFRRSSKLTAMLVAAAAVVSIVPATAAERLGTKDGNITNAVAFNGGYIYDGYRTDDDDASLYYNNGTKDVEVDADEDYSSYPLYRYGSKYATVVDGTDTNEDDNYLLDLSNGKIDDEESLGDKKTNAENKLKTKISKTDRYNKSKDVSEFNRILDNKYGEVWYQYKANEYSGFTDDAGNYIDVTQTANMYVYNSVKKDAVKFSEYGDTNNDVKLNFKSTKAISQDKDNIYAVTTVTTSAAVEGEKESEPQYFFQKISKAQGDKEDDAYLPKSVASYQLDNGTIYKSDDDRTLALNLLVNGKDGDYSVVNYEVKNATVYVTGVKYVKDKDGDDTDEVSGVKVWALKFKKDKVDASNKDKVDTYIVKKDGDTDNDAVAYSIDANGTTWYLNKGTISKIDGTDKKDVYTCDRSLNALDVYDENNLIAWDTAGDVYTTVSEGKKQTDEDAGVDEDKKDETPVVKAGWDKNADGTWAFYKDGAKATGWLNDKGTWYYLDAAGTMKTGWVQAGSWYYLNASGAMQTGWVNDNGTWYYCNGSGAMQTGWLLDGSTWYYLNANGSMAANTTVDGYVLGANGAML
ncbi:N-acetylmuramoyl-L-alanine amidase family protein [Clostridium butyricum]|uniref:Autolysin n=1 Tax=Clostridium butyricum TaxID=1492 RepID=A0A6N3BXU4_CLOBU